MNHTVTCAISTAILASILCVAPSCTKAQTVAAVNTGVQIGVDICKEAPNLLPPGTPEGAIVALLCPSVINGAPDVEVFVDSLIWNAMKAQYAQSHAAATKRIYK